MVLDYSRGSVGLGSLCFVSCLVFLAYTATQNLESSLSTGTIGTTAVGVIYLSIICATPFAPKVITTLGRKWSLVLSTCTYVVFIASNLFPVWEVMIPAAVVLGIGGSIYWPTTLSLIKHFSVKHSSARDLDKDKCLDTFSSAFWGSFQVSQLLGSLLIYIIIQKGGKDATKSQTLLAVVFTVFASLGCLSAFLLVEDVDGSAGTDALREGLEDGEDSPSESEQKLSTKQVLDLLLSPKSLLLIGVYFYNGMEQGFAWCDFTFGMVLAAYDDNEAMIGILMLCYAASNALTGSLAAQVSSSGAMTRGLIFCAAAIQSACVLCANFLFSRQKVPLYVTAVVLGAGDALLNTKIGVLLGMDFKGRKHVIMVSMWRGFTSLGCAIPFFLSGHTKIDVNVIMLAVSAAAALVLFSIYCTILNGETSEKEGVDEEDVKAPMLKSGGEKE